MKPGLILIAAVAWALTGCAGHYHAASDGQVDIYLWAPGAASVVLVVVDEAFREVQAVRTIGGTWKTTLKANHEFTYFYLVDGQAHVPECALKEKDDYGGQSCVYVP